MSKLLKVFLAVCTTLGLSTIAFCSFLIFTNMDSSSNYSPSTLATKPIACGKKIKPSDTFWTSERFKF